MKILATLIAFLATLGISQVAQGHPLVGPTSFCASGRKTLVGPYSQQYVIIDQSWKGNGVACVTTDGGTSFRITRVPWGGTEVKSFVDIGKGCGANYCTPNSPFPVRVSHIQAEHSYVRSPGYPAGEYDKAYDIYFGTRKNELDQRPDGAELMIWTGTHGGCCSLASDAQRVRIDGKLWLRSYWGMERAHARWNNTGPGVTWRYIQYRLVKQRASVHIDIAHFIHNAERVGQIKPWWWQYDARYGFEQWSGGKGLQVTNFRLHVKVRQ